MFSALPESFDPDALGDDGMLFGLPLSPEEAAVNVVGVPFEVSG